jgi:hypothetical protein
MRQSVRVVHVLVSRQSSENRLAKLRDHSVAAVAASARVSKNISCNHAQAERSVEFSEGEQPAIGRDLQANECQLELFSKAGDRLG